MKLIDAMKNVDKSNPERWLPFEDLCNEFGLYGGFEEPADIDQRLIGYDLVTWICTDTHVGLTVVYFDGEPAATIWQSSRKGDKDWKFVSAEIAKKIYDWIVKSKEIKFNLIDPDEEIGDTFTVNYGCQIVIKDGLYEGRQVKVTQTFDGYSKEQMKLWKTIVVQEADGTHRTISVDDFHIPFKLAK